MIVSSIGGQAHLFSDLVLDLLEFLEWLITAKLAKEKFTEREHTPVSYGNAFSLEELRLLVGDGAVEADDAMGGTIVLVLGEDRSDSAGSDGVAEREGDLTKCRDLALRNLRDQLQRDLLNIGQGEHWAPPAPIISL
ncbi:hypothetical protein HRbin07_00584 [bacterium HR07]|nr:hypothetical protein HRbin07_00584 [bacterium HR07]